MDEEPGGEQTSVSMAREGSYFRVVQIYEEEWTVWVNTVG